MKERHITLDALPPAEGVAEGRKVVAVVGIDRYRAWPTLDNAVSDAQGALGVFQQLGFEQIVAPLINETATADAIHRLVTDDLATLRSDDSLVLFFAGHGHTQTRTLQSGPVQTGYIIPVDGDLPDGRVATWLRLDTWLSDVARLPARHILVILDACHSGIVLGSLIKWRGGGDAGRDGSLDALRRRQSRRVITSALGDQRAMDSGPILGHSLFTGCLIEGLTGGLARDGRREATGSELGVYVQQRVASYTGSQQTPDFGTLELDNRGELVVPIATEVRPPPRISGPPIEAAPVDRSARALHAAGTGGMVRWDGGTAAGPRRVSSVRRPAAPGMDKYFRWGLSLFGYVMAIRLLQTWTLHSRFAGVQVILAALPIVLVIVVGRVVATAPAFLRSFSAAILRRRFWVAATGCWFVLGVASGTCARAEINEECDRQLANGDGVPQVSHFIVAFGAHPAEACQLIGRDDDARRVAQAASRSKPSEPAPHAPEAHVNVPEPVPVQFPGASCADIISYADSYRGLPPKDIPKDLLYHIVGPVRGKHLAKHFVLDGNLLFLESVTGRTLTISRAISPTERETVKTISFGGTDPHDGTVEVAVGAKTLGVALRDIYKHAYFLLIDPKKWTVLRMTEIKILPPEELMDIGHLTIGYGDGTYGVLARDIVKMEHLRGESLAVWTMYDEKGAQVMQPTWLHASRLGKPLWMGSSFVALGAKEGEGGDGVGIFVLPAKGGDTTYFPWFKPDQKITGHQSVDAAGAILVSDDTISVAIERKRQGTDDETYVAHGTAQGKLTLEKCK